MRKNYCIEKQIKKYVSETVPNLGAKTMGYPVRKGLERWISSGFKKKKKILDSVILSVNYVRHILLTLVMFKYFLSWGSNFLFFLMFLGTAAFGLL